jgi:hypothetical protein|tara:strand:- start:315 stop:863 length:549 start_codon:yes stop_codon:yes gene_type:complete
MNNLAFYASPIDFNKNEQLDLKIQSTKKNKLNSNILKELTKSPDVTQSDINNIHNNLDKNLKEENENVLADFYETEKKDSESNNNIKYENDMYITKDVNSDYMISNNLNINKVSNIKKNNDSNISKDDLLERLNYIITLFEEGKEIKTNKKNEEIVLYCFLGVFMIYVLDSFVSIGKYKRDL